MNLDVAEIFKPIMVDRLIFTLINRKMLTKKHFVKEMNGILLNEDGRKLFITELDKRLKSAMKPSSSWKVHIVSSANKAGAV